MNILSLAREKKSRDKSIQILAQNVGLNSAQASFKSLLFNLAKVVELTGFDIISASMSDDFTYSKVIIFASCCP